MCNRTCKGGAKQTRITERGHRLLPRGERPFWKVWTLRSEYGPGGEPGSRSGRLFLSEPLGLSLEIRALLGGRHESHPRTQLPTDTTHVVFGGMAVSGCIWKTFAVVDSSQVYLHFVSQLL